MIPDRLEEVLGLLELEDYLMLAAVLSLPWAFGGVELWAYRSASMLIAASAGVALAKRGWAGLGLGRRSLWLAPAFLLLLWAIVQIVPLPPSVVKSLSPEADRIYSSTFPGYAGEVPGDVALALEQEALDRVAEAPDPAPPEGPASLFRMEIDGKWGGWRTLSLQPGATAERLFWFLALLLAFLVVKDRTADPDRWRTYRSALLMVFAALATFALVQAATWNGKIYWTRAVADPVRPFGPYVNPTHFGGAMELAVAWLAAYTAMKFLRPERAAIRHGLAPIAAGGTAMCFIAGLASASKAASVMIVVSVSVIVAVAARGRLGRLAAVGSLAVVWGGATALYMLTPLGDRVRFFLETRAVHGAGRVEAWRRGWEVFTDYRITGSGFGTFREVFAAYVPPGEYRQWAQLHNDYLEVLLDGGLVAGVLLAWLTLAFVIRVRFRRPGERRRDLESLGLALGLGSLAVHAFMDFNHQIPANALLFVSAAAMLLARGEPLPEETS